MKLKKEQTLKLIDIVRRSANTDQVIDAVEALEDYISEAESLYQIYLQVLRDNELVNRENALLEDTNYKQSLQIKQLLADNKLLLDRICRLEMHIHE